MHDVIALIALVVIGGGGYLIGCRLHPYAPCRSCAGRRGRNAGSSRRVWGRCRTCGGTGERLRWGARLGGRDR